MSSDFHRSALNKHRKDIYDEMLVWFREGITEDADERAFSVKKQISPDDASEAMLAVIRDHPDLVCIKHTKGWHGAIITTYVNDEGKPVVRFHDDGRDLSHAYPSGERERLLSELDAWKKNIVSRIRGNDDYERVISLVRIFSKDLTYTNCAPAHDIAGVLTGFVVCEAISLAFKVICDILGIWCIVVTGTAKNTINRDPENKKNDENPLFDKLEKRKDKRDPHAWNIVKLGEKYYIIDPTWSITNSRRDPMGALGGGRVIPSDGYLFLTDSDVSETHLPEKDIYPKCDDDSLEFYRKRGWVLHFNEKFTACLDPGDAVRSMVGRTNGLYGDVYILKCRLINCNGSPPPLRKIPEILSVHFLDQVGYDHSGRYSYFYDEIQGNLMLIFEKKSVVKREAPRGRLEVVQHP